MNKNRYKLTAICSLFAFLINGITIKAQKISDSYSNYQIITDTITRTSFLYDTITKKRTNLSFASASYGSTRFKMGFVKVKQGDMEGALIKLDGTTILEKCHFMRFYPNDSIIMAWICSTGWIMINYNGDTLHLENIKHDKYYTPTIDGDIFAAKTDQGYGYLNKKGEWIIKPQFEYAGPFVNEQAKIMVNQKWKIINAKGDFINKAPAKLNIISTPLQLDTVTINSGYLKKIQIENTGGDTLKLSVVTSNQKAIKNYPDGQSYVTYPAQLAPNQKGEILISIYAPYAFTNQIIYKNVHIQTNENPKDTILEYCSYISRGSLKLNQIDSLLKLKSHPSYYGISTTLKDSTIEYFFQNGIIVQKIITYHYFDKNAVAKSKSIFYKNEEVNKIIITTIEYKKALKKNEKSLYPTAKKIRRVTEEYDGSVWIKSLESWGKPMSTKAYERLINRPSPY